MEKVPSGERTHCDCRQPFCHGLGSSETNGWVSAQQLHPEPPLGLLYAYVLASNFLVPMQVPAALRAARELKKRVPKFEDMGVAERGDEELRSEVRWQGDTSTSWCPNQK